MLSPYITHRRPDLWKNPEIFEPDRFIAGSESNRESFAYFPFGGGPRVCIGRAFSMLYAQLALAALVVRLRPISPDGSCVSPDPTITLRPKGGLPLIFVRAA